MFFVFCFFFPAWHLVFHVYMCVLPVFVFQKSVLLPTSTLKCSWLKSHYWCCLCLESSRKTSHHHWQRCKIWPGIQKCKFNSLILPSHTYKAMKLTLANRSRLRTSRKWLDGVCRDERTPISAHSHGKGGPSWRPSKLCGCCSLSVRVPPIKLLQESGIQRLFI